MIVTRGIVVLAILGAFGSVATISDTPDEALTESLQRVMDSDEFAIAVTHLRATNSSGIETLLVVHFAKSSARFVASLDRRAKRIAIERFENGNRLVEHLTVATMNVSGQIENIIFHVQQQRPFPRIDIYVNCVREGSIPLKKTFRDTDPEGSTVQFKGSNDAKIYVTSLEEVLSRENCPLEVQIFEDTGRPSDARVKRQYGNKRPPNSFQTDCIGDAQLARTLNDLTVLNTRIGHDLQNTGKEVAAVRNLLEGCTACNAECAPQSLELGAPNESCGTNSPCYPGAECRDTVTGPWCICPSGYSGDGRHCEAVNPCESNPCFSGVKCHPQGATFRCDPCPLGYTGNGVTCRKQANPCDRRPCFKGVQCRPTRIPPYYSCGSCPTGYNGDGQRCTAVDFCDPRNNPCGDNAECINLYPGYRCEPAFNQNSFTPNYY